MSINTIDNKKLLWATLQDNNCFEGLQDHSFTPVQQQFENFVLQNEKKRVKNELKVYDQEFINKFKRAPTRSEKEPMRNLYMYYKRLK